MRFHTLFGFGLLLVFSLSAKDRDWQSGKLIDSQSTRDQIVSGAETTGTISPDNGGGSTISASTRVSHWNINDTEMVIEGRDYAYLVERQTARTWDGKLGLVLGSAIASMKHHSCRFVIGDNVSYAQSKNRLYLIDADGKECKFEITRQERVVH